MEGIEVINGDSLAILPTLSAGSFDAVVTDPPFGIGFDYSGKKEATSDPAAYWEWFAPIHRECLRCLKPGGFFAIWQTQLYFRHFWDWFGDSIHIYAACKSFVQIRKTPINYAYDPVVMGYKPGADPLRPASPRRNVDFFVANTTIVSNPSRIEKAHPCPRPLDQVIQIVDNFTLPGGKVLDPFAGSGTTLVACKKTGRRAVGIDIEPLYIDLNHRRLAAAATPMFDQLAS